MRPLTPANPWVWAVPMASFLALAAIWSRGANIDLLLALQRLGTPAGSVFWADTTVLGDTLVMLALLLPFSRHQPRLVWAVLLGGVVATLWVHGLKNLLALPRPAAVLPPEALNVIGSAYYHKSFPSGHATTAMLFAASLCLYWRQRWLCTVILPIGLLIGISRVMVGAHWPADVLAGVCGGWLAAVIGLWWAGRWDWGRRDGGQKIVVGVLVACALWLALGHNSGYAQARGFQITIAVLSLTVATWFWSKPSPSVEKDADNTAEGQNQH